MRGEAEPRKSRERRRQGHAEKEEKMTTQRKGNRGETRRWKRRKGGTRGRRGGKGGTRKRKGRTRDESQQAETEGRVQQRLMEDSNEEKQRTNEETRIKGTKKEEEKAAGGAVVLTALQVGPQSGEGRTPEEESRNDGGFSSVRGGMAAGAADTARKREKKSKALAVLAEVVKSLARDDSESEEEE